MNHALFDRSDEHLREREIERERALDSSSGTCRSGESLRLAITTRLSRKKVQAATEMLANCCDGVMMDFCFATPTVLERHLGDDFSSEMERTVGGCTLWTTRERKDDGKERKKGREGIRAHPGTNRVV